MHQYVFGRLAVLHGHGTVCENGPIPAVALLTAPGGETPKAFLNLREKAGVFSGAFSKPGNFAARFTVSREEPGGARAVCVGTGVLTGWPELVPPEPRC